MKRRIAALLTALCMLLCAVVQAEPAQLGEPLRGEKCFPEGATREQARFVFTYAYPQLTAKAAVDESINAFYQGLLTDMLGIAVPQEAEQAISDLPEDSMTMTDDVSYTLAYADEDYVSFVLTQSRFIGFGETLSLSAQVFARTGEYAGQPLSLSQVMGLEQADDEPGASYAAHLVYGLVWEIVEQQRAQSTVDYLEGLTREELERSFFPEEDFYLDENGDLTFYVQSGLIAGDVEGVLVYPFSRAEILSAVK